MIAVTPDLITALALDPQTVRDRAIGHPIDRNGARTVVFLVSGTIETGAFLLTLQDSDDGLVWADVPWLDVPTATSQPATLAAPGTCLVTTRYWGTRRFVRLVLEPRDDSARGVVGGIALKLQNRTVA